VTETEIRSVAVVGESRCFILETLDDLVDLRQHLRDERGDLMTVWDWPPVTVRQD
jgi:hypothetical protein